jgi:hypothetical protein
VRHLGYTETKNPLAMPVRDAEQAAPLHPVNRPPAGIDGSTNEISIREDVVELWELFRGLKADKWRQFLRAGAKLQEALIHWQDRDSLSFALLVVACEALKPLQGHERYNGPDVIEALLGKQVADRLRQQPFPAQWVRSSHLHVGEFHGSELDWAAFISSTYRDPSFDEIRRDLTRITRGAIVEWLKRSGDVTMPVRTRRRTVRRWVKDNALVLLPVAFAAGGAIGSLARIYWP